jgi:hypothetical protein
MHKQFKVKKFMADVKETKSQEKFSDLLVLSLELTK